MTSPTLLDHICGTPKVPLPNPYTVRAVFCGLLAFLSALFLVPFWLVGGRGAAAGILVGLFVLSLTLTGLLVLMVARTTPRPEPRPVPHQIPVTQDELEFVSAAIGRPAQMVGDTAVIADLTAEELEQFRRAVITLRESVTVTPETVTVPKVPQPPVRAARGRSVTVTVSGVTPVEVTVPVTEREDVKA